MDCEQFVGEHNHGLTTPRRVHLLRSHRAVSATKKALTQQFSEANMPTDATYGDGFGGPSSVGCVEREISRTTKGIYEWNKVATMQMI